MHQQPAGVEADPPSLLLGADVDSLLPAGVAAGVSLRRPAVQRKPLVQGQDNTHIHVEILVSAYAGFKLRDIYVFPDFQIVN